MKVAVKIESGLLLEFNQLIKEFQCIRRDALINKVIRYAFQYDLNLIKYTSNNSIIITIEGIEYKRVDSLLSTITITLDTNTVELIKKAYHLNGINNIVAGAMTSVLKNNFIILYRE